MKRKRRKSRLIMDFMELISETTKFLRDAQYLGKRNSAGALREMLRGEPEWLDLGYSQSQVMAARLGGLVHTWLS